MFFLLDQCALQTAHTHSQVESEHRQRQLSTAQSTAPQLQCNATGGYSRRRCYTRTARRRLSAKRFFSDFQWVKVARLRKKILRFVSAEFFRHFDFVA